MTGLDVSTATVRPRRSTTDELLAETVRLATRVRGALVADVAPDRRAALRRLQQVAKVGELTALLGYCVAWLLARKAVAAGELSAAEGRADTRRLGAMPALVIAGADIGAVVGAKLAALVGAVRALHARLAQLDEAG